MKRIEHTCGPTLFIVQYDPLEPIPEGHYTHFDSLRICQDYAANGVGWLKENGYLALRRARKGSPYTIWAVYEETKNEFGEIAP